MNLELLLSILIVLIVGIIFLKAIRHILTIVFCLVLLYFVYFTFFTFPGAVKFEIFKESYDLNAYRVSFTEQDGGTETNKVYNIGKGLKKEIDFKQLKCQKEGPVIACEPVK